jgi:hydrogenase/urease accessory protein HupE
MIRVVRAILTALSLLVASAACADELRPAYLDIREKAVDEFAVLWKVPALGDLRLGLYVRMPAACTEKAEPVRSSEAGSFFERWTAACPGGLKGREIVIDGLRSIVTDVLVHIEFRDGSTQVARLTPERPSFAVGGVQTRLEVAQTYFALGVDHILTGLDHLLFVLALVLLIPGRWMLLKTITAFTVAHSLTLVGATLGYMSLQQKPMEATIALSIAFAASELVKVREGQRRLSQDAPWIIAFTFGLLHGFGFAGALKEIGLPHNETPLALLMFNVGVEVGQLIFVAAILLGMRAVAALFDVPAARARLVAAYAIGVLSMTWFVFRIASF